MWYLDIHPKSLKFNISTTCMPTTQVRNKLFTNKVRTYPLSSLFKNLNLGPSTTSVGLIWLQIRETPKQLLKQDSSLFTLIRRELEKNSSRLLWELYDTQDTTVLCANIHSTISTSWTVICKDPAIASTFKPTRRRREGRRWLLKTAYMNYHISHCPRTWSQGNTQLREKVKDVQ